MKYAISTDGDHVSAHFGRCPEFVLVETEDGNLNSEERVVNPGHSPGFLPGFLAERGVGCIIAGGIGPRAQSLFAGKGIDIIIGVQGLVTDIIRQLREGTLKAGPSLCAPGSGRGYGVEKSECTHGEDHVD